MKRYTFLLLAFFLSMSVRAAGFGVSTSMTAVSIAPNGNVSTIQNPGVEETKSKSTSRGVSSENIKRNSARNTNELGNIEESTIQAQQPAATTQLNRVNANGTPNVQNGTKSSMLKNVSCKTYEGKVYDQGEAGYNDCIRTIKNDRQSMKTIP